MKALNEIIKTGKELIEKGYSVENDIIKNIDLNCIGHFGNVVSFEIFCKNSKPHSMFNNTLNVGSVFRAFIELFELENEDGIRLSNQRWRGCWYRPFYERQICTYRRFG